jgi:regulatory protein
MDTPDSSPADKSPNPAPCAPGRKNSLMPSATGIRRAAMDWLARRECARCELEQKLHRRFPDATAAIGPVLDELEHQGLLSTERFVESFTRSRIHRGHGPRRIAADLRSRGIRTTPDSDGQPQSSGNKALEGVNWLVQACEARRRRFGEALPAGPVERNRQMAFLQRRGFSAAVCRAACMPPREID